MDRPIARTVEDPLGFSQTKRLAEEVRPKTILIVDDDADTITLVERIERKAGYRVFGAASGEECLSLLPRVKPQLIMLDVNMADLDGFETCCRVRSDPHGAHVPIAFLTARKAVNDVKRGVAAGADDFVVKPFDAAQLVERIEFMTSCSHLLNEHRRRHYSIRSDTAEKLAQIRPQRVARCRASDASKFSSRNRPARNSTLG